MSRRPTDRKEQERESRPVRPLFAARPRERVPRRPRFRVPGAKRQPSPEEKPTSRAAFLQFLLMAILFVVCFVPFAVCVLRLLGNWITVFHVVDEITWMGGSFEGYGFGLVFTGLGTGVFGYQVLHAYHEWRHLVRGSVKPGASKQEHHVA